MTTKIQTLIQIFCIPIMIKMMVTLVMKGRICHEKISLSFSNAETPFLNLLIRDQLMFSEKNL